MKFAGLDIDYDVEDFLRATEEDPLAHDAIWTRPRPRPAVRVCYERALDLADALTIDGETETFAYVSGAFVMGDLIEALVERRKLSIRRLHIQMLSLNDENIDSLVNTCLMSRVERLDLILSGYWYATELKKGGLVSYLFQELDLEGLDLHVAIAEVHCKVVAIETWKGNTLTIHGSANLRSNSNVEQIMLSPDPGLFEFVTGVGDRIMDAYGVLLQEKRKYKSRRLMGGALWHAVSTAEADEAEAASAAAGAAAEGGPRTGEGRARSAGPSPRASSPGRTTSPSSVVGTDG